GEPITGFEEGRPLFVRMPDSRLTLANFMRTQIYSALGTLKIGMDILTKEEKVKLDNLLGHGGFFKTERVGQQIMADAMEVPVSLMETAGEGGPWGMALLAAYLVNKEPGEPLESYLDTKVFAGNKGSTLAPDPTGVVSFNDFMAQYREALHIERVAIKHMR
uniref:FGGY-family carbohydrate kinase n=1 Tax=Jeotgalibaca porci TaxID=1868793 RepID=UPI0035A15A9A